MYTIPITDNGFTFLSLVRSSFMIQDRIEVYPHLLVVRQFGKIQ